MPVLYGAMIPDSYFPYSLSKSNLLIAITLIVQLKQSKRDRQNKVFFYFIFQANLFSTASYQKQKKKGYFR